MDLADVYSTEKDGPDFSMQVISERGHTVACVDPTRDAGKFWYMVDLDRAAHEAGDWVQGRCVRGGLVEHLSGSLVCEGMEGMDPEIAAMYEDLDAWYKSGMQVGVRRGDVRSCVETCDVALTLGPEDAALLQDLLRSVTAALTDPDDAVLRAKISEWRRRPQLDVPIDQPLNWMPPCDAFSVFRRAADALQRPQEQGPLNPISVPHARRLFCGAALAERRVWVWCAKSAAAAPIPRTVYM